MLVTAYACLQASGKKSLRLICFLLQSGSQDGGNLLERLPQAPLLRRLTSQLRPFHQALQGCGFLQHLRRQTQIGEDAHDLLYLPHPAVRFGRHARDLALEPLGQRSLAILQLVGQDIGQAERPSRRQHLTRQGCEHLLKGADQDETLRAIKAVSRGEAIFSPAIAQRLIRYFSPTRAATTSPQAFPELTEREREILTLLAQGHTNAEIAQRLVLSPKTVRNHLSNIFNKLQVAARAQAIIRAREAVWGQV